MKHIAFVTFAIVSLAGSLPMRALADPGEGAAPPSAAEQQVAADRFRVRYTGQAAMSADQVKDAAMLRAAQLTIEKGADWFEILPAGRAARLPSSVNTDFGPDYSVTRNCTATGCTVKAQPMLAETGAAPVYEHSLEIMIGSGETLEGGRSRIYNAREMVSNLSARVS
jgi:hypothetical protein